MRATRCLIGDLRVIVFSTLAIPWPPSIRRFDTDVF
jgi:hypothetical protein